MTTIRPATDAEAHVLSALPMRAKAHWGYPNAILATWETELTVLRDMRAGQHFVAVAHDDVAGFYSLAVSSKRAFAFHRAR
jgi:hypothetical protein